MVNTARTSITEMPPIRATRQLWLFIRHVHPPSSSTNRAAPWLGSGSPDAVHPSIPMRIGPAYNLQIHVHDRKCPNGFRALPNIHNPGSLQNNRITCFWPVSLQSEGYSRRIRASQERIGMAPAGMRDCPLFYSRGFRVLRDTSSTRSAFQTSSHRGPAASPMVE